MQRRIESLAPFGGGFVRLSPRVEQVIGLAENESSFGKLRPFIVDQCRPHITHMAETDLGCAGKLGDAPWPIWLAQQHAQDAS